MKKELLVVVDMINGFINEGPLCDTSIQKIIPANVALVKEFLASGKDVIAFRDVHEPDAIEFEFYPAHCVKGTLESELVDELKVYQDKMIVIPKNTTNGFFTIAFQTYLAQHRDLTDVTISGCCTDICVFHFAISLKTYTQTIDWPLRIHLIEAAVDTFDASFHSKAAMQNASLQMMKAAGILVE